MIIKDNTPQISSAAVVHRKRSVDTARELRQVAAMKAANNQKSREKIAIFMAKSIAIRDQTTSRSSATGSRPGPARQSFSVNPACYATIHETRVQDIEKEIFDLKALGCVSKYPHKREILVAMLATREQRTTISRACRKCTRLQANAMRRVSQAKVADDKEELTTLRRVTQNNKSRERLSAMLAQQLPVRAVSDKGRSARQTQKFGLVNDPKKRQVLSNLLRQRLQEEQKDEYIVVPKATRTSSPCISTPSSRESLLVAIRRGMELKQV